MTRDSFTFYSSTTFFVRLFLRLRLLLSPDGVLFFLQYSLLYIVQNLRNK